MGNHSKENFWLNRAFLGGSQQVVRWISNLDSRFISSEKMAVTNTPTKRKSRLYLILEKKLETNLRNVNKSITFTPAKNL